MVAKRVTDNMYSLKLRSYNKLVGSDKIMGISQNNHSQNNYLQNNHSRNNHSRNLFQTSSPEQES